MPYLQMAAARGLGTVDFDKLQVKGQPVGIRMVSKGWRLMHSINASGR
jgi:hypothetical protein